jgi:hypothetical protein
MNSVQKKLRMIAGENRADPKDEGRPISMKLSAMKDYPN